MENIADKMRRENAEKFETIKKELTDIVVNDIKNYGECKVNCYTTESNINKHNVYGYFVDKDFRIAIKEHFEKLGFVVKTRYIGYSNTISGYNITL